ncbi:MAG: type I restriction enzyme HsdR N-terminal domain-containing protein [bacterium]|nr:type I restriction enzyme HsdR N-terminal domain-containing protein [bacterium]
MKVRFLVPLLERLGLHRDDLHFERSFSFKAGRSTIVEDAASALQERRPRLDILYTCGGRNLWVLEAKAPSSELTDDDRLQAVSYARLVHPMAPYALVTNGQDTKLFDVATRRDILPENVNFDGGFEISLPSLDDFNALDCFLRLTPDNLLRFCRTQTRDNMRALRGSAADLTKKYIPELHVPRSSVGSELRYWL